VEDPFHLGSCGKAITATMAAVLIERGEIDWSTTVGEVFPEFAADLDPGYRDVTLEMLLCHEGGIAERTDPELGALAQEFADWEGQPVAQRVRLLRRIMTQPPTKPPGKGFDYSNYGYMIAAAMLEKRTGKEWAELVLKEVFEALEMRHSGIGSPAGEHVPVGHFQKDGKWEALPSGPKGFLPTCMEPAGLLHASLGDWARFVQEHLDGDRGLDGLVSAETFQHLHRPWPGSTYACGWGVVERPWAKGKAFTHNGSDGTWHSVVWAAPTVDVVIVAATNGGNGAAALDQACVVLLKELGLLGGG